jgi:GNAT superfamily N-acetyltransferase
MSFTLRPGIPDALAFKALYDTTKWGPPDRPADFYQSALEGSWHCVGVFNGNELIGCGRLISDGKLHAFITEMIVHPSFRGQGIGKTILRALLEHCSRHGVTDVQLFSASGKSSFYLKNGFVNRPESAPGMQYTPRQSEA